MRVEEKGENKYSYRRCIESKQASSFLSHFVLVKCKVEKAIKIEEKEREKKIVEILISGSIRLRQ